MEFLSDAALAAVNLVMPLIAIAFSLAELIATGSSVQLAILLGQKEHDRANRTFSVCIKVIVGMSFLIGLRKNYKNVETGNETHM